MGFKIKLKRALLIGMVFSIFVCFVRFLFKPVGIRRTAFVILGAAVIIFLLRLLFDFAADKIKTRNGLWANVLFGAFAIAAFFLVTVYTFAPALVFKQSFDEEAYDSMAEYQDIIEQIEINDGEYSGWLIHNAADNAPLVLYYGGNEDNSSARMAWFMEESDRLVTFSDCNFAYVDYPGYGRSKGEPSEESLKEFALSAYDYFDRRRDVNDIIILGYSLDTGVANYVAGQRNPAGMILMAPYADGYDLYNNKVDIFHGPMRFLVSFKMPADDFAYNVSVKPLILASKTDEVVPYESSVRLFQAYGGGCDFATVSTGHREFWENKEVMGKIKNYIADFTNRENDD